MAKQNSTTRAPQRKKKTLRFNKETLDALPAPRKRSYYYDDKVPQLGITHLPPSKKYPEGSKSFFARVTRKGATKRVTLTNGAYPGMPIDLARERAIDEAAKAARGTDSIEEKQAEKAAQVVTGLTVAEAVTLFGKKKVRRLSTGEKLPIKQSTIASYRHSICALLGKELFAGSLVALTEEVITKRVHLADRKGKTYAATGCRSLSAVWNWLARQREYRDQLPPNPVKQYALFNEGLHVAPPRKSRIERDELPAWMDAVETLPGEYADFFQWLLFTGNRFSEAKGLQWSDIHFPRRTYQIRDTKNRRDATLPLPDFIANRLKKRRREDGLVFTFEGDARYHRKAVCAVTGKQWSNHDLRRTFAGVAQSVCSYTSVKRLMNHAFTDVTENYIGESANLHEEIDKVQREILRLAGRTVDNVVKLEVVR